MEQTESLRRQLYEYVKNQYQSEPEYLWQRFPNYAIFRHLDNRKWFGIIMDVPGNKLGLDTTAKVDILNVKVADPFLLDLLLQEKGYYRVYHQNKGSWISIILDGTVPLEEVCRMIDESYRATGIKPKKIKAPREPKEWLIPANPKYFDIEHAFDETKEIIWKQGRGILVNDTVYLYAAAPVGAILYRCRVVATDIPYDYHDGKLTISAVMKISLERRYDPADFTFKILRDSYNIFALRGPRGVPHSLSCDLNKEDQ